jgi:hypothetical protein
LVYFFPFWYVLPRKIWQPCCITWRNFRTLSMSTRILQNKCILLSSKGGLRLDFFSSSLRKFFSSSHSIPTKIIASLRETSQERN